MPLLDPDAPRPKREPTAAELALAGRAVEDALRTLNSPAALAMSDSLAKLAQGAADAANAAVKPLSNVDLAFAMSGITRAAQAMADSERERTYVFEQMGANLARALRPLDTLPIRLPPPPPPPATRDDVRRLERRIADLEALMEGLAKGDPEMRQRVTQTDLRTERIARHFDDPDQSGQGQADDAEG